MKFTKEQINKIILEELEAIQEEEAMFQGNKRIDPSSMPSGDMGRVQPVIDAHIRLGRMLQQSLETNEEAADLFDQINVMLGELADSLD